jgi:hypothetical protein
VTVRDELTGRFLADTTRCAGDEDRLLALLPRAGGAHDAVDPLFALYNQLKPSTRTTMA